MADQFFARPDESVRGWERAVDAQSRVVGAVEEVLAVSAKSGGNVAVFAYGGVGTPLLCYLRGDPIGRRHDQPPNSGGN